jgi:nicotinamide mononucleotide transporter
VEVHSVNFLSEFVLRTFEIISVITGVGYAVLAAMRNRLCWIAGAVSSTCAAVAYGASQLPMQSGLQVFFVVMALYGWFTWTRNAGKGD